MCRGRDGKPERRSDYGEVNCPPPCRTRTGCPKGTPEQQKSLNHANELCYEHYRECRATGRFPDDPIVMRNAAIIREVEDGFEKYQAAKQQNELIQLMMVN